MARSSKHRDWIDRHRNYESDECLVWPFAFRKNGYGAATYDGKCTTAHRIMCIIAHGHAPSPRHDAAHSCGNRACANPRHIRWATRVENQADRFSHGTDSSGERQYRAKLRDADVRAIKADVARGAVVRVLADQYGVSRGAIHSIIRGNNWKHIQ